MRASSDFLFYFPFPKIRPEQVNVLKLTADPNKPRVLLEAPTGAGKTIAALAGSLLLADRLPESPRIFIFARTYTQINAYLKALHFIMQKKSLIPFSVITGKKSLCKFSGELAYEKLINLPGFCQAVACPLYSPSLKLQESWSQEHRTTYYSSLSSLEKLSLEYLRESFIEQFHACPFYQQKPLLETSKVILTTYPFLSDPYFTVFENAGIHIENSIAIIDEAHNLLNPKTKSIHEHTFKTIRLHAEKPFSYYLANEQRRLELQFLVHEKIMKRLHSEQPIPPALMELYSFLDTSPTSVYYKEKDTYVMIDPNVAKTLDRVRPAKKLVFMSATLQPFRLYAKIMQLPSYHESVTVTQDHRHAILSLEEPYLTSQYRFRSPKTFQKMGEVISYLTRASPRGSLVVTPSYNFLMELSSYVDYDFIEQKDSTSMDILQVYQEHPQGVSLIVNGGKFTEGSEIILPRGSAISLIIFTGIPYPPPGVVTNTFLHYVTKHVGEHDANELLYTITPSRLIRQAVGRTTRNKGEKGVGVILDYRIPRLMKYLPILRFKTREKAMTYIKEFFMK